MAGKVNKEIREVLELTRAGVVVGFEVVGGKLAELAGIQSRNPIMANGSETFNRPNYQALKIRLLYYSFNFRNRSKAFFPFSVNEMCPSPLR